MIRIIKKNKSAGFTVIEMVAVLAIIVVVLAITINNFPQSQLQFSLNRVTNGFQQSLRRAQDLNLSQVQYKDPADGIMKNPYGYGVNVSNAGNVTQYIIYADVNGDKLYSTGDFIVDTINFGASDKGIVINAISGGGGGFFPSTDINFSGSNSVVTITNGGTVQNSASIVFSISSDATKTKTVLINNSGLLQIQ